MNNKDLLRQYPKILCVVHFALLLPASVHAAGVFKIDSSGFLRRSEDRADSSSTLSIGPQIESKNGRYTEGRLDLKAIVQISDNQNMTVDRSAFTLEATNAYLATSRKILSKHQFTLGRRHYDWANFDRAWQLGTYSPRFTWDPTRPEIIGLSGAFHTYESRHWRFQTYGSPVNIPERGYPMRNENGRLISSNPFQPILPERAVVAKRSIPIVYNIEYPPMSELTNKSGAMTSVRYSTRPEGQGIWTQGTVGYMPIHQANLAVLPKLRPQSDVIDVRVVPEIQRHRIATLETGYRSKRWGVWASATDERPNFRDKPNSDAWIMTRAEPATILSGGGDLEVGRWRLNASYLYVDEAPQTSVDEQEFTIDLGSRFQYQRAARAGIEFRGSERMTYAVSSIADLTMDSQLVSFDATYQILKKDHALTLNLGSDFFASSTSKGFIGQYKGNDRFRGGITYAF